MKIVYSELFWLLGVTSLNERVPWFDPENAKLEFIRTRVPLDNTSPMFGRLLPDRSISPVLPVQILLP